MYYLSMRKKIDLWKYSQSKLVWKPGLHFHLLYYTPSILSVQPHHHLQIMCPGGRSTGYASLNFFFCFYCFGNSQIESKQHVYVLYLKISQSFHKEAKGICTNVWFVLVWQTTQQTFVGHLNPLLKILFTFLGY